MSHGVAIRPTYENGHRAGGETGEHRVIVYGLGLSIVAGYLPALLTYSGNAWKVLSAAAN